MRSAPEGPRNPLDAVVARRPGSLRRTMHVDVGPPGTWSTGIEGRGAALVLRGAARDARTDATGPAAVVAAAEVTAELDEARRVVRISASPSPRRLDELVGARPGSGFRRALGAVLTGDERAGLVGQVLDDLPAAVLISGYAWLRLSHAAGHDPADLTPPEMLAHMRDLCSGWRDGGTAVRMVAGGRGVPVQDCPPAPPLDDDDPDAWHVMGVLPHHWMRRRRLIDVAPGPDGGDAVVWAMFRDTVGEPEGRELVLHEYALTATVADADGRLLVRSVSAEPRVLPFPECPAAAAEVTAVVGQSVGTLATSVPELLTSIRCCTHLNDLLRSLGGVAATVAAVLAAPASP